MENADLLMLSGVTAFCPDCHDERVFVPVGPGESCCTTCAAAVVGLDLSADDAPVVELAGTAAG